MVAKSTLSQIRLKFRRITGAYSENQIKTEEVNEYINLFYQFDFPEHLKLFASKGMFEFLTTPNVDSYSIVCEDPENPAFNELVVELDGENVQAQDMYYNFKPSSYINGEQFYYYQNREQFFKEYLINKQEFTLSGDGFSTDYTFTLPNVPVLKESLVLSATNSAGDLESFVDSPKTATTGVFKKVNQSTEMGSINYTAGAVSVSFIQSINSSEKITVRFSPYQAGKPQGVCFYGNNLIFRPVPDKVYSVQLGAFLTPKGLISDDQNPVIKQWWQYIAFGAAKKYFEDTRNDEGLQQVLRPFKEQERLILHRNIVQQSNQRTATIYNTENFNSFFINRY